MAIYALSETNTYVQTNRTQYVPTQADRPSPPPPGNYSNSDTYEPTQNVKENINNAMKEGQLTLREGEKYFFGLLETKAEYTYTCNGKENIAMIKAKFGLKDGAIS